MWAQTMARDVAGGAGAFSVHRAFELGTYFESEVLGDDVGLDRGGGTDVDTIGCDVAFELAIDGDRTRSHGGMNTRSGSRNEIVSFDVDGALEKPVDHHVFTCDQFSLDDQCRSAAHGSTFTHPYQLGKLNERFGDISDC